MTIRQLGSFSVVRGTRTGSNRLPHAGLIIGPGALGSPGPGGPPKPSCHRGELLPPTPAARRSLTMLRKAP